MYGLDGEHYTLKDNMRELVDKRGAETSQFEQDISSPISHSLVDVDEFIQKQKDGGVEKIMEVLQKQIDEWMNKK